MSANSAAIEARHSGVYRAPAHVGGLQKAAAGAGLEWIELPLQTVSDKQQFLAVCAKQLKLPPHFGGNWDALADCVRDFGCLGGKGYVLHIAGSEKFSRAAAEDYRTALDVLNEGAKFWKDKGKPFVVLVDGAGDLPAY